MNKKLIKIFSTFITLVFIGAIIYLGINLFLAYQKQSLSASVIFSSVKIAFLIIGAATLLTAVLLASIYIIEKKTGKKLFDDETDNESSENIIEEPLNVISNLTEKDESISIEENTEIDNQPQETEELNEEKEITSETIQQSENENIYSINHDNVLSPESVTEQVIDENQAEEDEMIQFDEVPVISYDSGVSKESNFIPSLEFQLLEAESENKDLALYIISIPELKNTNPLYSQVGNFLASKFNSKQFVFEFKEDSFAVISKGTEINTAEDYVDSIYGELNSIISDFDFNAFVGISCRSSRQLDANRLILEAAEALKHALEDTESPIIGFHVDIEKYNQMQNGN